MQSITSGSVVIAARLPFGFGKGLGGSSFVVFFSNFSSFSYFFVFSSWGNTHFCEPCHQKAYELRDMKKDKLPKCPGRLHCPLKCDHPPNGEEFSLGCGACNNANSQVIRKPIDAADKGKDEVEGDDGSLLNAGLKLVGSLFKSNPAAAPKPNLRGSRKK